MESFEPKQRGVKEKNFYILHLDTPRIIILASVLIGIITAAFLLGMGVVKSNKSAPKEFAIEGADSMNGKNADLFGKDIPPLPDDHSVDNGTIEDKFASLEDKDKKEEPITADNLNQFNKSDSKLPDDSSKMAKNDVLKSENIREIIPPALDSHKKKNEIKTTNTARASREHKKDDKAKIASRDKASASHETGKTIHEVSREIESKKTFDGYSIQVASYDTREKAEREKNLLKSKRFDAYITSSIVGGKNYFRVRVGPVASQKSASALLEEIQRDLRYSGSYIVKE